MYDIHFRRFYDTPEDRVVLKRGLKTLEQAEAARIMSGDLVVFSGTNKVVPDPLWLFKWEREDKTCHAQKAIAREGATHHTEG